ncbi:hypothetical protein sscle_03g028050 [Sclerotinia sclerotiorum 1980 UF-70]|uniref:Uncharacterized protein n=1 Tax=Sclerotinia sclerotiorum (strain ATCC 18683 / 1980 / Ss-1) TaxID=665079 RepID=A0A1D9PZ94_SCLS1|nr:hypothetical protein sscle_03g028050 [Sclerotinia sclerotiorum 1980 UF-70]
MPRKPTSPPCTHPHLLTTSHSSTSSTFSRASPSRRAAAASESGIHKPEITDTNFHRFVSDRECASTFPGPLVLDGDDLEREPRQMGQSFRAWERGRWRNFVGKEWEGKGKVGEFRRTIYVVAPPGVDGEGVEGFMRGWCEVEGVGEDGGKGKGKRKRGDAIENGGEGAEWETGNWVSDIISYLQAFYHGLPVKQMDPTHLHFTPWEEDTPPNPSQARSNSRRKKNKNPPSISLHTSSSNTKTRIRYRATPSSPFSHQLNLSDLLDSAIDMLPSDAYALLILVNHDLYEDDDDEFICGRAYGGSRVAVVSTARYNPLLDETQGIERIHGWPGSHCADYINGVCGEPKPKTKTKTGKRKRIHENDDDDDDDDDDDKNPSYALNPSPLHSALTQQTTLLHNTPNVQQTLHLSRICRIASHELGHCFGIAHCIYYACSMQGSGSIIEDARQPPYLCPVDLKKVVTATGGM